MRRQLLDLWRYGVGGSSSWARVCSVYWCRLVVPAGPGVKADYAAARNMCANSTPTRSVLSLSNHTAVSGSSGVNITA